MTDRYENRQIFLHWMIVVLVVLQFVFHESISETTDRIAEGGAADWSPLVGLHIFLGFMIFALTLLRLNWRLSLGTPAAPEAEPAPFRFLAKLAHWAFYAVLIAMPISGAVAWFRRSEAAGEAHEVMKVILLALIALHIAGALVHQFVWKTDLIRRMVPRR